MLINEKYIGKKFIFIPLTEKNIKKIYFFSSHVLKISAILLVLRTREIIETFNTIDEIYLVFTSKSKYPLCIDRNVIKHTVDVLSL